MNQTLYEILFEDGLEVEIIADSLKCAKILAQAERIKRCEPYEIASIGPVPSPWTRSAKT